MKRAFTIIIVLFSIFLFSCNQTIENAKIEEIYIKEFPNQTFFYYDEKVNFDGLIVEALYSDGSKKIIDNYNLEYTDFSLGQNTINIIYDKFVISFYINIVNYEKKSLKSYNDYKDLTIENISYKNSDQIFSNVIYGGYRGTDKMIVYDNDNFVSTNIYGYEISCDEYGTVVEVGKNVNLLENGFVISGHGISSTLLKSINIGDLCIYIDNMVFVYQNHNISRYNKIILKFNQIIKELNNIYDIKIYNYYVEKINSIIDVYNNLDEISDLDGFYEKLCNIFNGLNKDIFDNIHKYSFNNQIYSSLENLTYDFDSYIYFISYTEKLYNGGFRNEDTLVYYDKSNYRNRNEYGYEVAVDLNGYIIDMGTIVELPNDGYILSGHGSGADFIRNNLQIGNKVEITNVEIKFYKDFLSTIINDVITERNYIVKLINENINNSIPHDYQYINKLMTKLDDFLENVLSDFNNCFDFYDLANNYQYIKKIMSVLYSQLIDYNLMANRGMWYYPFSYPEIYDDTTYEGVVNTLNRFKEMGINEIVIIPFKGNYCLYNSDYYHYYEELNNYNYSIYGNDYLKCFITEAHKRNICVNAFTQTFRCYEEGSKVFDESNYQIDYNGEFSRGSIYYYDICSDYVQDNLILWYKELIEKYDFDKVEYDIIRYSFSNLFNYLNVETIPSTVTIIDPGYTEYSINKFMKMYNLEGDLKTLIKESKDVRKKWLEFKENELIEFISNVTNEIKTIRPDTVISAAVLNDYENVKYSYLQDAKKWLELGIIDEIEPMVYDDDYKYVTSYYDYYNNQFKEYEVKIGLSYNLSTLDLLKQIQYCSSTGWILYDASDYLKEEYYQILKNSYHFNYISYISNKNEIENAVINDIIDKIENFYEVKNNTTYGELINSLRLKDYNQIYYNLDNIDDSLMQDYIKCIIDELLLKLGQV